MCSTFAAKYLQQLSDEQLARYDRLLDENDWDLYYWAAGEKEPPVEISACDVFQMMREHFKNEAKEILRMPEIDS